MSNDKKPEPIKPTPVTYPPDKPPQKVRVMPAPPKGGSPPAEGGGDANSKLPPLPSRRPTPQRGRRGGIGD